MAQTNPHIKERTMAHPPLAGRTIACPYPCGGTWTITSVRVQTDGVIEAVIRWDGTGSDTLDGHETSGSLAPGTALWKALETDRRRSEENQPEPTPSTSGQFQRGTGADTPISVLRDAIPNQTAARHMSDVEVRRYFDKHPDQHPRPATAEEN